MKIFKTIFVCVLLVGILSQLAGKLLVLINFELNKEYIVKNICVEKDEEENCCQGSCHLKQELAKQEEPDDKASNQQKIKSEQDHYCNGLFLFAGNRRMETIISTQPHFQQLAGFTAIVFQPPQTNG